MASKRKIFEGQLYKYTNVMKGWQYRWFILHCETGLLAYFMPDDTKRQRPRGAVKLSGAVISPSDEDSQTFSVNFATGDIFKLRAADAKERQLWVNQLRSITQKHTQPICQQKIVSNDQIDGFSEMSGESNGVKSQLTMFPNLNCANESINEVKSILLQTELSHEALIIAIESLPNTCDSSLKCCDKDLLLMKATARATIHNLEQCLFILSKGSMNFPAKNKAFRSTSINLSGSTVQRTSSTSSNTSIPFAVSSAIPPLVPDEEEVIDSENSFSSESSLSTEENKNLILSSLSQMKLGMDLSKVKLPVFILEPFSLLEMYSNFMSHPDLFVQIVDHQTPQERMIAVLKWYLTAFFVGQPNSFTHKPINPILGETFQCSWRINDRQVTTQSSNQNNADDQKYTKVHFVAEQVSHHPPTSAFYVECVEKQLYLNAHLTVRSKFMGMNIGLNMIGELILCDLKHNEEYIINVPSLYVRSILSVPWVEFGGKVTITSNTGCTATSIFHTKPFYGGKLHRVTAEVKTLNGDVLCKVNGEWNGSLEFSLNDGTASTVDTPSLPIRPKYVQKIQNQPKTDSRKVWMNVSSALKCNDISQASKYKQQIEEQQRSEEKMRKDGQTAFQTQFFQKDDDGKWLYRQLFKKSSN